MTGRTCAHFDFGPGDPAAAQIGLGAAALQYAGLGYAVLPLARGAKKPHRMLPWAAEGSHGVHYASRDYDQIWDWWRQDPAANIGVATGSPSGLVVLDLDVKKGNNGPQQLRRFEYETGCAVPAAGPFMRTPSGGWHIWLRWPAAWGPVPERPGILPGVDVKGDGGLIVAPPSMAMISPIVREGDRGSEPVPVPYEIAAGCPCSAPAAPSWLPGWLASAPAAAVGGAPASAGEAPGLEQLRRTGIPRGQRNATLYKVACSRYRVHGTSGSGPAKVAEELREVWQAGDTSDMTWREVAVIIESARRFIAAREQEELAWRSAWLARNGIGRRS